MASKRTKGVQQARHELTALVDAAHRGNRTIITKHGKPYAAIVPADEAMKKSRGVTVAQLRGTGRKIWKRDAAEKQKTGERGKLRAATEVGGPRTEKKQ